MGWDKEAPPTETVVERVMEVVRAAGQEIDWRESDCRRDVIDSLRMIAKHTVDVVPAGAVRDQLREVAKALKLARLALTRLPPGRLFRKESALQEFLRRLDEVRLASEELADKMIVKRSGGDPSKRGDAARKRIAAGRAFQLLDDWGRRPPTLTKGGEYVALAGLLFESATGREPGDMERVCTNHFKKMRENGFPNAEELRRIRKEGKRGNQRHHMPDSFRR